MHTWNRALFAVVAAVALTQSAAVGQGQTQGTSQTGAGKPVTSPSPTTQTPATPAAQTPAAQTPAVPVVVPPSWTFAAGSGMVFFQVKAAQAPAFEGAVLKLKAALAASKDPMRKRQAQSWQVLKSTELGEPTDPIVYIFFMPVTVADTDYDPLKILTEQFPAEAQALYDTISVASTAINRLALKKFADMGSGGS
jgi:hypothetical protein